MRLYIEGPSGALFDYNDDCSNILAPSDESERTLVFDTLVNALAVLSSVKPRSSFDAKASEKDRPIEAIERCPADRKSGSALRLVGRQDVVVQKTTPE